MVQESLSRGLCTDKCLCFLLSTHPIENSPCLPGEGQVLSCGVLCSTGQTRNCPSAENDADKWRSHRRECRSAGARPTDRPTDRPTQPLMGLGFFTKKPGPGKQEHCNSLCIKLKLWLSQSRPMKSGEGLDSVRGVRCGLWGLSEFPCGRGFVPQQLAGCTLRAVHAL